MLSEVICILPKEKEAHYMQFKTVETDRKKVVKAIAEFLGEAFKYAGPPTFAYKIGEVTVDREGTITIEDEQKGEALMAELTEQGFMGRTETEQTEDAHTAVKITLEGMTPQGIKNLVNLIHSKQYLINKSIKTQSFKVNDALITALEESELATADEVVTFITEFGGYGKGFSFADGCILFEGFPYTQDSTKVNAYMELASAMVKAAKEQKRISPKETIEENEKYYMRTWLVRHGFDGKDAKDTRKVLLDNLKGHTAFRTEADKVKWNERQKARKAERGVQ